MRRQTVILIIFAFLQSTILPFNLVLIFLLLKAYFFNQRSTLYMAFFAGLLLSLLLNLPLGFLSIIYIFLTQAIHIISRLTFASNVLALFPLLFITLALDRFLISLYLKESMTLFPGVLVEVALAIPMYILLRLLDEKLNIKSSMKI